MSDLAQDGLPPLRDVIAQHGLSARKSLGQNFLLDLNLTRRIARASGNLDGAKVIEVGPGPGGLTRALLMEGAAKVTAIERDSRCLKALDEIARHYPGRLTVIEGDAMDIDVSSHLSGPTRIVANLPYNIGTALLTGWLSDTSWPPWWESLTLLFQKEVAERITAAPGSKSYGRLSVLGQWRSMARGVFEIPPQAFTPAPKVTSALVHITPKNAPTGVSPAALERLTASAFGQRRKMLRQSLKGLHTDPIAVLESCGIAPTERAENVPIEGYLALARALSPQPSA